MKDRPSRPAYGSVWGPVFAVVVWLSSCGVDAASAAVAASPLPKVIQLITDLQAKTLQDGEAAKRTYDQFVTWCQLTAQEKQHIIKSASGDKNRLEAAIQKADSQVEELSVRIQELSGSIATDEADLKAATEVRKVRRGEFEQADQEMSDIISTLERAHSILERELSKIKQSGATGGAFLDRSAGSTAARPEVNELKILQAALGSESADRLVALTQSLGSLVDAAGLLSAGPVTSDMGRFKALLQMQEDSADSDDDVDVEGVSDDSSSIGTPSVAAYLPVSGSLLKTLADTQDKAEASQDELRKKEAAEQHEFELMKTSLTHKMDMETKELEKSKQALSKSKENKAAAAGNLELTNRELASTKEGLQMVQHDCMTRASTFEVEMKDRKDELDALAKAKKVIQDVSSKSALQLSFLQVRSSSAAESQRGLQVVQRLRALAAGSKSASLAQVVSELRSMLSQTGHSTADPFRKVIGLIKNMIEKLQQEAHEEQLQKQFCDKEMAHTEANKEEKESQVEDLNTRLEKVEAEGLKLKEQVVTLSEEILELKKSQGELDKIRLEEHAEYEETAQDLKQAVSAVQTALGILREYYQAQDQDQSMIQTDMRASMMQAGARGRSSGSAENIIGLLEVVEADFSKTLAEEQAAEEAAEDEYNHITQDNKKALAIKQTEMKNKEQQGTALKKTASELESDLSEVQTELDAVNEYYARLKPQCMAKPETYEERAAQREKEIAGLKEAMVMLGEETAE